MESSGPDKMMEFLHTIGLSGEAAIPLLVVLVLLLGFIHIINAKDNPIQFWHFFSTYDDKLNQWRGSIDKLGQMAGVVACLFVIIWSTYKSDQIEWMVLGVCLIYLGGVSAFAQWLRMVAERKYSSINPPTSTTHEVTDTTSDKVTTNRVQE